jgi:hypothetical protein
VGQSNSGAGGDKGRGKVQKIMAGISTSTKQQQSGAPQFPYAQVDSSGEQQYKRRMAGEKTSKNRADSAPAIDPTTQSMITSSFNRGAPTTGPIAPAKQPPTTTTPASEGPSSNDAYAKLHEARRAAHEAKQQVRATRDDFQSSILAQSGGWRDPAYKKFHQAREARRDAVKAKNKARGVYNAAVTATQSTTPPQ